MNHRVRQKRPTKPVIVLQRTVQPHRDAPKETQITEANHFEIVVGNRVIGHVVYERKGLPACGTHDAKAWIEFEDDVQIREPVDLKAYCVAAGKAIAAAQCPAPCLHDEHRGLYACPAVDVSFASPKLPNQQVRVMHGIPPARD